MNKRKIFSAVVLFLCFIAMIFGFVKVNIINTKALSPRGNSNKNYEMVSEEFGDDFANFIKDNASVKIYKEENGEYLVKVPNGDYRVNTTSSFIGNLKSIGDGILGTINDIADGIKGLVD